MTTPTPGNIFSTSEGSQSPAADAERLVVLLSQQRDLYANLSELSARQQVVVAEGQTESLLGLLSERQILVDQLTQINGEVAPLRARMHDLAEAATEDVRGQIRSLVSEVQDMLRSIIERDEQDRQRLEESKAQVGRELAKVRTAPAAIHAYKTNAYAQAGSMAAPKAAARFTDARG